MSAGHISLGGGRSATIISEIGRGGMGVVFRAVTSDGSTVAIKVLGSGSSSVSLARFEREQRLLASFSEAEGFVPLIEAGETQVDERTLLGAQATIVLFIVMPFLAGGTLRNRIESGPMDVADVIEIGRALATALGHAHARGVVHRDLKPENVLFTDEGQPLVADLGLAKHFTREAHGASRSVSLSVEGQVRGTVGYMPPEQMADSSSVGPTADVYAIGIMLYECLTGRGPHPGDSALERLTAAQAGRVDRLRDLRPETPPWLARVVERCFAPTPERRFADARALLDALDGKSAGRRTGAVAALVLALVASGGLLALATRTRAKPSPVAPPAAGPAKTASPAESACARAKALVESHDLGGARAELDRAIAATPSLQAAWSLRARVKGMQGEYGGAVADASRAIELDPGDAVSYSTRGAARHGLGEVEPALADLDHAIELDPKLARAFENRALLQRQRGNVAAAEADEARALDLNPTSASIWFNRGVLRQQAKDEVGALECYTRAIACDPKAAGAYNNRAQLLMDRGDLVLALADFDRACALDPRDARFPANRADLKRRSKDVAGWRADLERALELDPANARGWSRLADAKRAGGDWPGAIDALTRAIDAAPTVAEFVFARADARAKSGDKAGALADLDRGLALAPADVKHVFARARARAEAGNFEGALTDYARVIELAPKEPAAYSNRAAILIERRDFKGAAADLERFLELAPDHPEASGVRKTLAKLQERE